MNAWFFITGFGDTAVILPCALILAGSLAMGGDWRSGIRFILALGFAIFMVGVTKVAFIGWGIGSQSLDFTGLSGHAALAAYFFACATYFITAGAAPWTRVLAISAGVMAALVIAVSRLVLQRHSPSEVVTGFVFGVAVAALMIATLRPAGALRLSRAATLLVLLVIVAAAHGHRAPSQRLLTRIALDLSGHDRPMTRERLLAGEAAWGDAAPLPAPPSRSVAPGEAEAAAFHGDPGSR